LAVAEISFQSVADAVTLQLRELMPNARIFTEEIPQKLEPSAFLVRILKRTQTQETGLWFPGNGNVPRTMRHKREPIVEVTYFPQAQYSREECENVGEVLWFALETVQTPQGDTLCARDMEQNISDNVLVMTMRYPHFVLTDKAQQTMTNLTQKGQ
jgi:hypothetical protein